MTDKPLPPRREADFYPTDRGTVRRILGEIGIIAPRRILDPGAGAGIWGEVAREKWPAAHIQGVELRDVPKPPAYDGWLAPADFLWKPLGPPDCGYDLVMGNPPYAEAEAFVSAGLTWLKPDGVLVYLLRLAFLEGQRRRDGLFAEHPPKDVLVCSKRPSFTEDGKTNATAFAAFVWRKGWTGETSLRWLK